MPIETKKGKIIVPQGNGFIQILPEVSTDAEASSTSQNPLASGTIKSEIQAERDVRMIVSKDDAETSMADLKTNGLGVCLEPECFRCTIQTDAETEGAKTGAIPFSFVGTDQTITVDWGDGTIDYLTAADYEPTDLSASIHEYAEPGKYQISVYADSFENEVIDAYDAYSEQDGETSSLDALCLHLRHFRNTLVSIDKPIPSVFGTYLFRKTQTQKTRYPDSILTQYGWGVNNVFGTSYDKSYNNGTEEIHICYPFLFAKCGHLVSVPDGMLSKTHLAETYMHSNSSSCFMMFSSCTSLKKVPDGIFQNIALSSMDRIFEKCTALESVGAVFQGQSLATRAENCFQYCSSLKSVSEDLFADASGITSFMWCFSYCTALESVPSNLFASQPNATSFYYCFYSCSSLTTIPAALFSHNASATAFNSCFGNCRMLQEIPSGLFQANTAASDLSSCFSYTGISSIPSGLFDACTAVTKFNSCFSGCSGLQSIPSGLFDSCTAAAYFNSCFLNCSSLASIPSGLFDSNTAAADFGSCFYGCTSLAAIPSGLFDSCTAAATFQSCFSSCGALQSIPSGLFDACTAATNFSSCFSYSGIRSIPSGLFDACTAVTTFSNCFRSCTAIQSIPTGLFDRNVNVTTFENCFNYCTSLETVPENLLLYNTATTRVDWFLRASKIASASIRIGSTGITVADEFIGYQNSNVITSCTIYVPAGSTTETTFRNASLPLANATIVAE